MVFSFEPARFLVFQKMPIAIELQAPSTTGRMNCFASLESTILSHRSGTGQELIKQETTPKQAGDMTGDLWIGMLRNLETGSNGYVSIVALDATVVTRNISQN